MGGCPFSLGVTDQNGEQRPRCTHHSSFPDPLLQQQKRAVRSPPFTHSPPGRLVLFFLLTPTSSDFTTPSGHPWTHQSELGVGPSLSAFGLPLPLHVPYPSSLLALTMLGPGPQPVTHLSMHSNCNSGIDLCLLFFFPVNSGCKGFISLPHSHYIK